MILKKIHEFYLRKEVYWGDKGINIILQKSMQGLEIWCVGSLVDTIYDSKKNHGFYPRKEVYWWVKEVNIILQ